MKKIKVLYVVLKCNTGSDRYYDLLYRHIPDSEICWLPKIYNFFPPLLLLWRLFSSKFKRSCIVHTNCEYALYLFSFKRKLIITFHHNVNFVNLEFYKKIYHILFTSNLIRISMLLAKKIIFVNNYDYVTFLNFFYLKNKCIHI